MRRFPFSVVLVLCTFFGMMGLVTMTAYTRLSGSTGHEMSKLRLSAKKEKLN